MNHAISDPVPQVLIAGLSLLRGQQKGELSSGQLKGSDHCNGPPKWFCELPESIVSSNQAKKFTRTMQFPSLRLNH